MPLRLDKPVQPKRCRVVPRADPNIRFLGVTGFAELQNPFGGGAGEEPEVPQVEKAKTKPFILISAPILPISEFLTAFVFTFFPFTFVFSFD